MHATSLNKAGNTYVICDEICPWIGVPCHLWTVVPPAGVTGIPISRLQMKSDHYRTVAPRSVSVIHCCLCKQYSAHRSTRGVNTSSASHGIPRYCTPHEGPLWHSYRPKTGPYSEPAEISSLSPNIFLGSKLYPYKSQWSLYVPPGLKLNNSTFCPHSVFMCFVWI